MSAMPAIDVPQFEGTGSRAPSPESRTHGITRVSLAELIALRARSGKPALRATRATVAMAGGHPSRLRGRGMDYAESRVYQPGDDVRCIDWRRTARSGRWHTKLFQEEREQQQLVLLDTNTTMRFGTRVRFKSVAAARAAAWWAWTGVRGGDRVGVAAFGAIRDAQVPHAGSRGALAVVGALVRWDEQACAAPTGARTHESLSLALQRVQRLLIPGSRAMLVSDGWCVDAAARAAMAQVAARVDLRVAIVIDALEHDPVAPGVFAFESDAGRTSVDLTSAAARGRFCEQLGEGWQDLANLCDEVGVAWTLLAAGSEPDLPLTQLWCAARRRR
jgi:uncharacterized protein (DUF58 family)